MACARCGCGVHQTEDIITLNKIWHKCCFTCYRCRRRLDKCTAKIFQGEVFCDCCYKCLLEELELLSSPSKPCRVVSSPSCTCVKENYKPVKVLPPFDNCSKKCNIYFQAKQKAKAVKSCSCLPDRRSNKKDFYCLAFPISREVANYCCRAQEAPKQKQVSGACYCAEHSPCRHKKQDNPPLCIQIRSFCQQPSPCPICRQMNCKPPSPAHRSPPPCYQSPPANYPPPVSCPSPTPCPAPNSCPPPSCCCSSSPQRCCLLSPSTCCPSPPASPSPPSPPYSPPERCCCPRCCPPTPKCKLPHCYPPRPACPKRPRSQSRRKPCPPCCPDANRKPDFSRKPACQCCPVREEKFPSCICSMPKYCPCGNLNPCNCKMCQVRAVCTPNCIRCGHKVYAAEKISVTSGAYHISCFSCLCCHKLLDVKNVYENCGEIYCKQCYNNLFGNQYYGYGSSQLR